MESLREFAFSVEYDVGADPLMDMFRNHSSVASRALHTGIDRDRFWCLEWVTGPEDVLKRVQKLRFDASMDVDSITVGDCGGMRDHAVLECSLDWRVLYTYWCDLHGSETVQTLIGQYLSSGTFAQTHRRGGTEEWRVLTRGDRKVGLLYDTLHAKLRDGLTFHMGHLRDADGWQQTRSRRSRFLPSSAPRSPLQLPRATTRRRVRRRLTRSRMTSTSRVRRSPAGSDVRKRNSRAATSDLKRNCRPGGNAVVARQSTC